MLARAVARRPGARVPGAWSGFELAVRAVLGQQISVAGATTLAGRLVASYGKTVAHGEAGLTHVFPSPVALAKADVAKIGLPRARGATIVALADAVRRGALPLDGGGAPEAALAALRAVPGVGAWTAGYVAMRALNEPDAFPDGDLGLCRATGLTPRELARRAERWRPWRAYAVMCLWATDTK
jgi:AraC family transcriptional regulator of adaptative response / DNA-3-methyladenine glycosylase II